MMTQTKQEYFSQLFLTTNYSYNELLGVDGNLQPHWHTFFESLKSLGQSEIEDRSRDILRLLKENGVTYNIYDDPFGLNRPWNLDIIPFLISIDEWKKIEPGLKQRATLLDLILKDIYGERQLIKNGLLPAELIYNHSGFLRQCVGIKHHSKHCLILYSADLARSANGNIWVLNDRTQAPSGYGYALENRTAMSRINPELFNGLKVRQLSSYFTDIQESLQEIAPYQKENPRVVILTPGPSNETYFEHSYLSSYMGFTLVQGDDLMVRDNYVWLKTIGGLEKVDVILRRVDDIYCDPLELKSNSQLGVSGLLQAIRSGNVSIANPLGSSVLENPGLMPFLQNIAKHFFNTDLMLPAIASWWCGQPKELQYVLNNIENLVIKRIFRNTVASSNSIDVALLTKEKIAYLKETIKTHPHLYVGQEKVAFASSPSLVNGIMEPRNALFRSFLVSNNNSYNAMTGGLTRTSSRKDNMLISNQLGGISKDTWILSENKDNNTHHRKELFKTFTPALIGVLPSHTAENLFWVGRYAERILGNARFQRTVMQSVTDSNQSLVDDDVETEQILLRALTNFTFTYPGFIEEDAKDIWTELKDILFDKNRNGSMSNNCLLFSRAVYAVSSQWSIDTWRVLRMMEEEWMTAANANLTHFKMMTSLDSLITSMVAFIGLNRESISREQGWIMLDMGRKIEQSLLLIRMLRATLVSYTNDDVAYNLQEAVLKSNEALVNYRYKYRVAIQLPLVLELLLLDPNNPRSLIYQLDRIKNHFLQLPKAGNSDQLFEHERLILEAHTLVKLANKEQLSVLNKEHFEYEHLNDFFDKIYNLLSVIPEAISKTYFKHAQAQKQLFTADV
jgi:uncharacterized circularly permuted ATP-grasp superfamily protein/uncharacterized alpha-E superfamily protein